MAAEPELSVQGYLEKKGNTVLAGWKVRFFDLKDNHLTYSKAENGPQAGEILLLPSTTIRMGAKSSDGFLFDIVTPDRVYQLRSNSEQARGLWVESLNKAKLLARRGLSPLEQQIHALEQVEVRAVMKEMSLPGGVEVRDRKFHMKSYAQCFVAAEAVTWLCNRFAGVSIGGAASSVTLDAGPMTRQAAVQLCNRAVQLGLIVHVVEAAKPVSDDHLFFRFTEKVTSDIAPPPAAPAPATATATATASPDQGGSTTGALPTGMPGAAGVAAAGAGAVGVGAAGAMAAGSLSTTELAHENTELVAELRERESTIASLRAQMSQMQAHLEDLQQQVRYRPRWVEDNERDRCYACHLDFSFFRRRHHCRRCGEIFCSECCKLKLPLIENCPMRVKFCDACALIVSHQ